ncbi:hypothetical protein Tco_0567665 [Tanacetum coccineum]
MNQLPPIQATYSINLEAFKLTPQTAILLEQFQSYLQARIIKVHSGTGHLSSRHGLTLKKFKKDAPCQAFKNQERHRLKGESSPLQRLKSESSPSPLLVSTCRNQQHLGRAFT